MDMTVMINHYKSVFLDNEAILEWIEHDLQHMGLHKATIEGHLNEARRLLEARS